MKLFLKSTQEMVMYAEKKIPEGYFSEIEHIWFPKGLVAMHAEKEKSKHDFWLELVDRWWLFLQRWVR